MEAVAIGGAIALAGAISGWIAAFVVQRQKSKEEIRAILAETQRDQLSLTLRAYKKRTKARIEAQANAIKTLSAVAVDSGGDARNALSILAEQLLEAENDHDDREDSEVRARTEASRLPIRSGNEEVPRWRGLLGGLLGGEGSEVRVSGVGVDDRN